MIRLLYHSEITSHMDEHEVQAIVEKANVNNAKENVTGLLLWDGRYFLQCLEGEEKAVYSLYNKIKEDKRHAKVALTGLIKIRFRMFEKWNMGLVGKESLSEEVLQTTLDTNALDPKKLDFYQAENLFLKLYATL